MSERAAESDSLTKAQKWDVAKIVAALLTGALTIFGAAGYFLIVSTSEKVAMEAVASDIFRDMILLELNADDKFDERISQLANEQFLGVSGTYRWSSGEQSVKLVDGNEGLCFLTSVKGKFEGSKQHVYVALSDDVWILGGASDQNPGVGAEARCLLYKAG